MYNGWQYGDPGVIEFVGPQIGLEGTEVTLRGRNLFGPSGASVKKVLLSGVPATSVVSQNSTTVVVKAGENVNDNFELGNVVIESESGATITYTDGWKYFETGAIDKVDPYSGQMMTTVVIEGKNMKGLGEITSVTLAGVEAQIISGSDTRVVVRAGRLDEEKLGSVVVTSSTGAFVVSSPDSDSSSGGFMYLRPGEFKGASPKEGQCGTEVTLCGEGMLQGGNHFTKVMFGGSEVDIVEQDDECLTVRVSC
jgi:hypothetical protein